jgi:methionyl-tRNA formyltransferase
MEDKLQEKLEQELKQFKQEVKEMGVDVAIDRAYELTVKQEIIDSLLLQKYGKYSDLKILEIFVKF